MRNLSKTIFALLILAGCATPYQEKGLMGGYTDFETQPGVYYVSFQGNPALHKEGTVRYWHRRADEICPNGYKIVSQSSESEVIILPNPNFINIVNKPRVEGYITCNQSD